MSRYLLGFLLFWFSAAMAEERLTLQFNPQKYGLQDPRRVVVRGSFTSWMTEAWEMQLGTDRIWRLTRPLADFAIPGNSGQPEYKFVVNDSQWIGAEQEPAGWQFTGNFVILFPGDDPADIARRDQQARLVRESYDSEEQLANFRALSGGRLAPDILFRSYHPFIPSRSEIGSEGARLRAVQKLMAEHQIAAVINLADNIADVTSNAPPYYADLFAKQNVLLQITSYEDAYFHPEGNAYASTLQKALAFVAEHRGPYLIHCRLGTDRTGVLSAVLEAVMGVPWRAIVQDYEKSNELGIGEYRHPKLLAYGFQRMLGQAPEEITDLAGAMRAFLRERGISVATLDAAAAHLAGF